MTTLVLAAVLFGVTALGGMALLALRLRGGNPPLGLAALHGLVAASALVTLAVAVVGGAPNPALVSLVLFGLAALGGFLVLSLHLRKCLIPLGFVLAHAALAVSGLVALLAAILA